jgi:hypothetical protein
MPIFRFGLLMISRGFPMETFAAPAAQEVITAGLLSALIATGRSPEIPAEHDVYGWLVGSWDMDVAHYWTDVRDRRFKAEAHFGWILEGRAVQDVWIMPARPFRSGNLDRALNTYGTTLRVWDAASQTWRVTWVNPVTGYHSRLVGRRVGLEIVQIGTHPDGTPVRWIFSQITPDSFRWTGESLNPDGNTWKLEGEFHARRKR